MDEMAIVISEIVQKMVSSVTIGKVGKVFKEKVEFEKNRMTSQSQTEVQGTHRRWRVRSGWKACKPGVRGSVLSIANQKTAATQL